jgi:hypothetical protein
MYFFVWRQLYIYNLSWKTHNFVVDLNVLESSWNVMAHGDAREGKWRGNWRMEWVASTLRTTPEHGVSSITTADAHTSAASSRLNWRPRRFKWTRPFRRKTKSAFCACVITFQTHSTYSLVIGSYEPCSQLSRSTKRINFKSSEQLPIFQARPYTTDSVRWYKPQLINFNLWVTQPTALRIIFT